MEIKAVFLAPHDNVGIALTDMHAAFEMDIN